MFRHPFVQLRSVALLALTLATVLAAPARSTTMAVPSYFDPGALWTQAKGAAPTVSLMIANPNSGPGTAADATWASTIKAAQLAGISVVGYVATGWGANSPALVKSQIDSYYTWYHVDGIFFDEGSTDAANIPYYSDLNAYVKAKGGKATTVINPGIDTAEGYVNACDIICNYEDTYANYVNWTPAAWVAKYGPNKFWHMVISCSQTAMTDAVSLAKKRNAGYVYVTSDGVPNPYDTLPTGTYWTQELSAIGAVQSSPALSGWYGWNDATNCYYRFKYTGTWNYQRAYIDADRNPATGVSFGGIGADYMIENGNLYAWTGAWSLVGAVATSALAGSVQWTVPRSSIRATAYPATVNVVFQVASVTGLAANSLVYPHALSAATGPIVKWFASNDGTNITYTANFTQAFTYHHVYIDTDSTATTGYAIGGIGAEYMIEEQTLYRWVGPGWNWTAVGPASRVISGATYGWTVARSAIAGATAATPKHTLVFGGATSGAETKGAPYLHSFSY